MVDGGPQAGTSHNLAQHFAKVFDITTDEDSQLKCASDLLSTAWWGLIMVHGDNRGLKLPQKRPHPGGHVPA